MAVYHRLYFFFGVCVWQIIIIEVVGWEMKLEIWFFLFILYTYKLAVLKNREAWNIELWIFIFKPRKDLFIRKIKSSFDWNQKSSPSSQNFDWKSKNKYLLVKFWLKIGKEVFSSLNFDLKSENSLL